MIDFSKPVRTKADATQYMPLLTAKVLGLEDNGWIKFRFDGSPPSHKYSAILAANFYRNFENYEPATEELPVDFKKPMRVREGNGFFAHPGVVKWVEKEGADHFAVGIFEPGNDSLASPDWLLYLTLHGVNAVVENYEPDLTPVQRERARRWQLKPHAKEYPPELSRITMAIPCEEHVMRCRKVYAEGVKEPFHVALPNFEDDFEEVSDGEQPVGDCVSNGPPCNPGPRGDYAAHGEPLQFDASKLTVKADKVHLKRRVIWPHPDRVFFNKPMRMKSTHADVTITSIYHGMVEFEWQIANSSSPGAATMDEFVRLVENYEPFEPSIERELDSESLPPQTPLEQVDDFIKFATEKFEPNTFHYDNDYPLDLEYVQNRMMRKEDFSSGVLAGQVAIWRLCKHVAVRCLLDQAGAWKVHLLHEHQVENRYRLLTALDLECALYLFDDKKQWLLREPVDVPQLTAGDGLAPEPPEIKATGWIDGEPPHNAEYVVLHVELASGGHRVELCTHAGKAYARCGYLRRHGHHVVRWFQLPEWRTDAIDMCGIDIASGELVTAKADGETIKLGPDGELKPVLASIDVTRAIHPKGNWAGATVQSTEYAGFNNGLHLVRFTGWGGEWHMHYSTADFERLFENTPGFSQAAANSRDDQREYIAQRPSTRPKFYSDVRTAEADWPNKVWIDLPLREEVIGKPEYGSFRADMICGVRDYPNYSDRCLIQLPHHDVQVMLSRNEVLAKLLAAAQPPRTYPTPLTDYEPKPATTPEAFK